MQHIGKEVKVEKFLKRFEYYIVIGLLVMMSLVVLLSTVELAVITRFWRLEHAEESTYYDCIELDSMGMWRFYTAW